MYLRSSEARHGIVDELGADFGRLALKILGGPQSRFPHPVSSGALGVDPVPGGKPLQSFDFFQRNISVISCDAVMKAAGGGSIVDISSISGVTGQDCVHSTLWIVCFGGRWGRRR